MDFNEQQLAAIRSQQRYVMVLAGAGTGKTRTVIGRAAHLLRSGTPADRIAIVTFTRRAAAEIKRRLHDTVGKPARDVIAGTFHHLCLRIMRAKPDWFACTGLTVLDRDDQVQLIRLIRSRIVDKQSTVPKASELINILSYARNTNQGVRKYIETYTELSAAQIKPVLEIFLQYGQRKQENGYLDYDDILYQFASVLHSKPEVRKRVCSRFDHLLVDEMQDTNPLQWLIVESFAKHSNLFCVGDDAQSIYAFRGADFRNVHSFEERLPGAKTLKLTLNYRSTQPILDVANWLLEQSSLPYNKTLQAHRSGGVKPQLVEFSSDTEEAEWIAAQIMQRREAGADWSDHMILCRTAWIARPLEAVLIAADIPYRFIGGMGLLQTAHVRDVLSMIRVVVNYRDELAWIRFLTLFPGIGEVTADRAIAAIADAASRSEAFERLATALPKPKVILELLAAIVKLEAEPAKAIHAAIKGIEPLLEHRYDDWDRRSNDLDLLQRMAKKFQSLAAFLETYTLDPITASEAGQDDQQDTVTLITVHSAKGTEAPVCFVPAVQVGNYPHRRSVGDPDAEEEERRVLYVALTRAQDELLISRHQSRQSGAFWGASTFIPQPYHLENLPPHLVDTEDYRSYF